MLDVEIRHATASVYVPAEKPEQVTENGKPPRKSRESSFFGWTAGVAALRGRSCKSAKDWLAWVGDSTLPLAASMNFSAVSLSDVRGERSYRAASSARPKICRQLADDRALAAKGASPWRGRAPERAHDR